jgi:carbonic anhydrase
MGMDDLAELLGRNRAWARRRVEAQPDFFLRLSQQQAPRYLWLGCSDSRVPANEILGLDPGEVFVHRNVANLAVHSDLNFLSVLQFAVEFLRVEHVIVTGHYGCGGVRAALGDKPLGLVDNWLRHLRDVHARHHQRIEALAEATAREDLLVELNVRAQVLNVARTPIAQAAWAQGRRLTVHGWVYRLLDGILHDLGCAIDGRDGIEDEYRLRMGGT